MPKVEKKNSTRNRNEQQTRKRRETKQKHHTLENNGSWMNVEDDFPTKSNSDSVEEHVVGGSDDDSVGSCHCESQASDGNVQHQPQQQQDDYYSCYPDPYNYPYMMPPPMMYAYPPPQEPIEEKPASCANNRSHCCMPCMPYPQPQPFVQPMIFPINLNLDSDTKRLSTQYCYSPSMNPYSNGQMCPCRNACNPCSPMSKHCNNVGTCRSCSPVHQDTGCCNPCKYSCPYERKSVCNTGICPCNSCRPSCSPCVPPQSQCCGNPSMPCTPCPLSTSPCSRPCTPGNTFAPPTASCNPVPCNTCPCSQSGMVNEPATTCVTPCNPCPMGTTCEQPCEPSEPQPEPCNCIYRDLSDENPFKLCCCKLGDQPDYVKQSAPSGRNIEFRGDRVYCVKDADDIEDLNANAVRS